MAGRSAAPQIRMLLLLFFPSLTIFFRRETVRPHSPRRWLHTGRVNSQREIPLLPFYEKNLTDGGGGGPGEGAAAGLPLEGIGRDHPAPHPLTRGRDPGSQAEAAKLPRKAEHKLLVEEPAHPTLPPTGSGRKWWQAWAQVGQTRETTGPSQGQLARGSSTTSQHFPYWKRAWVPW